MFLREIISSADFTRLINELNAAQNPVALFGLPKTARAAYIRALARDIGRALNSGAYLTQLCRTRVGDFSIDRCVALDQVDAWLDGLNLTNNDTVTVEDENKVKE